MMADDAVSNQPRILGIGGTPRAGSSTERVLRAALREIESHGLVTELITASELDVPMYGSRHDGLVPAAVRLLDAVRRADGLIVATPSYHGGISGLLKNALDHLQELAADPEPYLDGKVVGCIATAAGWQAGAITLTSLRSTVHALRAWPAPLGVVVNSSSPLFDADGQLLDDKLRRQLGALGEQVASFARMRSRAAA